MELRLTRLVFADKYTEGQLFIDDFYFCDTIEDKTRDFNKDGDLTDEGEGKVYGETAIPFGRYRVVMSYSNRFKRVMPEILNVKGFEGIRIHSGNDAGASHGCIITGKYVSDGVVGDSRRITKLLYESIEEAIKDGEKVYIEIV